MYIELKNKFNTCNSDALGKVNDKLLNILNHQPEATAYWAFIIPSTVQRSGCKLWEKNKKPIHPNLYKVWGSEVYKIVTGDGNNLQKLYAVLPSEIQHKLIGKKTLADIAQEITEECNEQLEEIRSGVYKHSLIKRM